jgi:hypothetical protein
LEVVKEKDQRETKRLIYDTHKDGSTNRLQCAIGFTWSITLMKKFSLLALGIAILTLGGCGASTPSPDEMGQIEIQNETQLQNIKLGVIAHLTRGEILCGQD